MRENILGPGQGFIRIVEHWGDGDACEREAGIIEAARQSTQKGFEGWGPHHDPATTCSNCKGRGFIPADELIQHHTCVVCNGAKVKTWPGDEKLLGFLYREDHATPFEFAGAVIEVEAPIFVFREWHRHRTQSYNEASARYAPLPAHDYLPTLERMIASGQAKTNRQASGELLAASVAEAARDAIAKHYENTENLYRILLDAGVAREVARVILPVGRFSRMRASANLRNWIGFMKLRRAPNAQWEIRQYANALAELLREKFPRTMGLAFPDLAASG